jgi:GNAT superfamily N-acetyltransferase
MHAITQFPEEQTPALLQHLGLPATMEGAAARVLLVNLSGDLAGQAGGFAVVWPTPGVAKLWLHVAPPFRREGRGVALLKALVHAAQAWGLTTLRLVEALDAPDARWFTAHGFAVWAELSEFSFRVDASDRLLHRLWERLKNTIPPEAEMVTLAEAEQRGFALEIAQQQAQAVGGLPSMLLEKIALAKVSGDDLHVSLDKSLVIILKGEWVAFSLARFDLQRGCWMIDGMVVAPAFRDGWATIWMRYELVQTGLRVGRSNEYRVQARSDQTNTTSFARKLGAQRVFTKLLLEIQVPVNTPAMPR